MCKLLSEWSPSAAAIDLIKLNGVTDDQMTKTLEYLKAEPDLVNIDNVQGYDNWDSLFIVFCIKANKPKTDDQAT